MTKTALITGASDCIGKSFAEIHASRGGDVILVARREKELFELKAELERKYRITAHVFVADLAVENAAANLYNAVKAKRLEVDYLINNAGFGWHGRFDQADISKNLGMVDLNVKALMALTHYFSKDMVAKGNGKILHVGSTAGMLPGPFNATYYASKAFVNSFSLALAEELKGTGVTSTVLAPGPVQTKFFNLANMEGTKLIRDKLATPQAVALLGYNAMLAGKLLVIDNPKLRFLLGWVTPFLPRKMVLRIARDLGEKV